ncbi:MAG: putative U6 snRNA-associated Sm protein LSm5 [Streblomastix strix]|uniref:Putative U6 snRNA-associated Sm protein LSm5 n=1 Tax=Streblomastix strix TaxID=222440 RepID=A0A5J4X4C5_9EUKA|nr:MAG: putative U6 snRNA-associated Sm protein LSm5 [Streblomastix strix]
MTSTKVAEKPISKPETSTKTLPLELVERCRGQRLQILMRGEKEIEGTLTAFDDFLNMVLDNVKEIDRLPNGEIRTKEIDQVLLNGTNIAIMVPEMEKPIEKEGTPK